VDGRDAEIISQAFTELWAWCRRRRSSRSDAMNRT